MTETTKPIPTDMIIRALRVWGKDLSRDENKGVQSLVSWLDQAACRLEQLQAAGWEAVQHAEG